LPHINTTAQLLTEHNIITRFTHLSR